MQYAISLSALVAIAFSATHEITVGPGLNYQPDSLTASSGDIVAFKFSSVEHDVVSGSFDSPCQPDGNIYSGDGSDGDVFSVTINGTDPIWIYCSVPGHCQGGMAMLINGNVRIWMSLSYMLLTCIVRSHSRRLQECCFKRRWI